MIFDLASHCEEWRYHTNKKNGLCNPYYKRYDCAFN